ncbi:MAG: serine--tRNA ligase, partial [Candidatus Avispirillum sp.]
MLDIKLIRENPEDVIARLAAKGKDAAEDIKRILELDSRRRAMIAENEAKKAEQNKKSKEIPVLKKEGKDVSEIFADMKKLSEEIKAN